MCLHKTSYELLDIIRGEHWLTLYLLYSLCKTGKGKTQTVNWVTTVESMSGLFV